jgi:hypothetical protein
MGRTGGRAQPQRGLSRLHGLSGHRQQLGGQGVQVDLLAKAGAERLDGLGGVVATPVEAAVDRLLDAAAGRLEHRGHGQGGGGNNQGRVLAQEPATGLTCSARRHSTSAAPNSVSTSA